MTDYILSLGDHEPYGFSAPSDVVAARHAAEYIIERHLAQWTNEPELGVTLAGPNGVLTRPGEGLRAFCDRINPPLTGASMEDVKVGDPMIPDCNHG